MKMLKAVLCTLLLASLAASTARAGLDSKAAAGNGAPAAAAAGAQTTPCANGADAFQPNKCPGGDANATALAEDMIKQSGIKFDPDPALAQQRHDEMLAALTRWVEASPQDALRVDKALAAHQTAYMGDDNQTHDLRDFLQSLTVPKDASGNPQTAGGVNNDLINQITQLSDYVKNLKMKFDDNAAGNIEDVKSRLGKNFDGSVPAPPGPNPDGSVAAGSGGKPAMLTGAQVIAGMATQDVYRNGGVDFQGLKGQSLHLAVRNKPDDPYGLYVSLSDVSNLMNIRGQTVAISPGVNEVAVLNGQGYIIRVDTTTTADGRDDYKVTVAGLDDASDKTLDKALKAGAGGTIIGKVLRSERIYGSDGLLADRVRQVYDDAHGPDAAMHIAYLGEGKNRHRYYVTVQGGTTVSYVFFAADDVDQAYAAIQQGQNGAPSDPAKQRALQPGLLVPIFTVPFAEANQSGVGVPFDKGDQPLVTVKDADGNDLSYHYVFDAASRAMVLTKMTADDVAAYYAKHPDAPGGPGTDSGAGAGSGDGSGSGSGAPGKGGNGGRGGNGGGGGVDEGTVDSSWPKAIKSDDLAECMKKQPVNPTEKQIEDIKKTCTYALKQSGANSELKKIGADYRVYYSTTAGFFMVSSAMKDKVVSKDTMQSNQLPLPTSCFATDSRARVEGSGKDALLKLHSKSLGCAYFFNATNPKTGLVAYADKANAAEPLDVKSRAALLPVLSAAGFSDADAKAIVAKAAAALAAGGTFSEINETQNTISLYMEGKPPVDLWTGGPSPAAGGTAATGNAKPSRKKAAGGAAPAAGDQLYAMNDSQTTMDTQKLPATMKATVGSGVVAVSKYSEFPPNVAMPYGAWYRDTATAKKWFLVFNVYVPKQGVSVAAAKEPDLVFLGHTDPKGDGLIPYDDQLTFKPLVVRDNEDAGKLHIMSDPKHPNAYAAYNGAYDPNAKYSQFIQHVAWRGASEPNVAEDGASAYAGVAAAPAPDNDWHILHPSTWRLPWSSSAPAPASGPAGAPAPQPAPTPAPNGTPSVPTGTPTPAPKQ